MLPEIGFLLLDPYLNAASHILVTVSNCSSQFGVCGVCNIYYRLLVTGLSGMLYLLVLFLRCLYIYHSLDSVVYAILLQSSISGF